MAERVLNVSEFKAKCLACLSQIEQSGEFITITRRGRPVAVVGPSAAARLEVSEKQLGEEG